MRRRAKGRRRGCLAGADSQRQRRQRLAEASGKRGGLASCAAEHIPRLLGNTASSSIQKCFEPTYIVIYEEKERGGDKSSPRRLSSEKVGLVG